MVLYHHGIKGMHWGIRRFQNKDGSLTAEGIKRYRTDLNFKYKYDKYKAKQDAKAAEKAKQKEIKRVNKLMNKDTRKLTAAELEERINRLAMETRIVDLERGINTSKPSNKYNDKNNNPQKDNPAVGIAKKLAAATATAIVTKASNEIGERVVKSIFNNKNNDQNQNQNQNQNQPQQKPAWTDKKVSGDYDDGITGVWNTGKNAFNNIWNTSSSTPISSISGIYSGTNSWTNNNGAASFRNNKSFDLYSWSPKVAETKVSNTYDSYSTTIGKSALNDIWGVAKSTPVSISTSGINIGTDSINYFTSNKPYSITTTKDHTMTGRLDGRAPTSTHRINKMIDQKKYDS